MNKDSKILIAGGTGLVGSNIINLLLQEGYQNILATYHHKKPSTNESDKSSDKIRWYKIDLTDMNKTFHLFKEEQPEYVILAAAKVGGIYANNYYRYSFLYENLTIQNSIIETSRKIDSIKKLIFLGSSCIYPKNCPQPIKENYLLTGELEYTNEPYAIAKIAGMKLCENCSIKYDKNFISLMPTNLYGPNDNYDLENSHVLPAMIRKFHIAKLLSENKIDEVISNCSPPNDRKYCQKSETLNFLKKLGITENRITFWGSGKPKREFLHVEDLAGATLFALENINFKDLIKNMKDIKNSHINIGTGKDISLSELAILIREIVNFDGEIAWDQRNPDGTFQKLLDVSKINQLGWKAKISLRDGIEKTYKNYLDK